VTNLSYFIGVKIVSQHVRPRRDHESYLVLVDQSVLVCERRMSSPHGSLTALLLSQQLSTHPSFGAASHDDLLCRLKPVRSIPAATSTSIANVCRHAPLRSMRGIANLYCVTSARFLPRAVWSTKEITFAPKCPALAFCSWSQCGDVLAHASDGSIKLWNSTTASPRNICSIDTVSPAVPEPRNRRLYLPHELTLPISWPRS